MQPDDDLVAADPDDDEPGTVFGPMPKPGAGTPGMGPNWMALPCVWTSSWVPARPSTVTGFWFTTVRSGLLAIHAARLVGGSISRPCGRGR